MTRLIHSNGRRTLLAAWAGLGLAATTILAQDSRTVAAAGPTSWRSHAPMRPLPTALKQPLAAGPKLFVDAARGDDRGAGTAVAPWKTLAHALRRLKPGDTLYLRGGTYYEKVFLSRSGTAEAPITIASYPGELAIIDGGLARVPRKPRDALGAVRRRRRGRVRFDPDLRRRRRPPGAAPVPARVLGADVGHRGRAAARPGPLRRFDGAAARLSHGHGPARDQRALARQEGDGRRAASTAGRACGSTARPAASTSGWPITSSPGLGDRAYRGETDPRKLPLVVAAGFGDDVLRVSGVQHVRLRGAGAPRRDRQPDDPRLRLARTSTSTT